MSPGASRQESGWGSLDNGTEWQGLRGQWQLWGKGSVASWMAGKGTRQTSVWAPSLGLLVPRQNPSHSTLGLPGLGGELHGKCPRVRGGPGPSCPLALTLAHLACGLPAFLPPPGGPPGFALVLLGQSPRQVTWSPSRLGLPRSAFRRGGRETEGAHVWLCDVTCDATGISSGVGAACVSQTSAHVP